MMMTHFKRRKRTTNFKRDSEEDNRSTAESRQEDAGPKEQGGSGHNVGGRAGEARVCIISQLEATGLVTCEVKKIKESKKPRTNRDFVRLGAWVNGGGELRRQSQCVGKRSEYRTKFEVSIRYPGKYIEKTNGNAHLKLWRYQ